MKSIVNNRKKQEQKRKSAKEQGEQKKNLKNACRAKAQHAFYHTDENILVS